MSTDQHDGGGATRLEGPPATRIEGVPATRLEGPSPTRVEGVDEPYFKINLPHALAVRFEPVDDLGGGAEADVLLVRERESGELSVLKLYRRMIASIDGDLIERIRTADPGHVVRLLESGQESGTRYELLEYCELGSLRTLIEREGPQLPVAVVREVVDELSGALEHIHARECVHRDLKPENVLVRERRPLDLVLADFGLATVLRATREFRSTSRTVAYAAPERASGGTSRAIDWWALGIVTAELALGHHPLVGRNGDTLDDLVIQTHIHTRPIELSGIADERLRLLCRGLLVRDPDHRWGAEEVAAWRRGESPAVAEDAGRAKVPDALRFRFRDGRSGEERVFADPVELALALADAANWDEAATMLAGGRDHRRQHVALQNFLRGCGLDPSLLGSDDDPEIKLIRLLCSLDPEMPPVFRGSDIGREGLALLASSGGGDTLRAMFDLGVLDAWASQDAFHDYADLEERWRAACKGLAALALPIPGQLERSDVAGLVSASQAGLLLSLLGEGVAAERAAEAAELAADEEALAQGWFASSVRRLRGSEPAAARDLLLITLGTRARRASEADAEERRAAAEAERALQRAAHRRRLRSDALRSIRAAVGLGAIWLVAAAALTVRAPTEDLEGAHFGTAFGIVLGPTVALLVVMVASRVGARMLVDARVPADRLRYDSMPPAFVAGFTVTTLVCTACVIGGGVGIDLDDSAWRWCALAAAIAEVGLVAIWAASWFGGKRSLVKAVVVVALIATVAVLPYRAEHARLETRKAAFAQASTAFAASTGLRGCAVADFAATAKFRWADAAIRCRSGSIDVRVMHARDAASLERHWRTHLTERRFRDAPAMQYRAPRKCVSEGARAVGWWTRGNFSTLARGQVACAGARPKRELPPRIDWTATRAQAVAVAKGGMSSRGLIEWWMRHRSLAGKRS